MRAYPRYLAPGSMEELLPLLQHTGGEARLIAGGTDLIPQMRVGRCSPSVLIDLRQLAFNQISFSADGACLDALVTHSQVIHSTVLQRAYSALVGACRQVGGPPVRNRGTLAGNLANASPAADSALPLLVYDAVLELVSQAGERRIVLSDFFLGPGQTALKPDELIHTIQIPAMPPRSAAIFLKLGKRQAMAIAVASTAVRLSADGDGKIVEARIALGSLAPTPRRVPAAEALLLGNPPGADAIEAAAEAAAQAATPISDVRASAAYRRQIAGALVRRALLQAADQLIKEAGGDHN